MPDPASWELLGVTTETHNNGAMKPQELRLCRWPRWSLVAAREDDGHEDSNPDGVLHCHFEELPRLAWTVAPRH